MGRNHNKGGGTAPERGCHAMIAWPPAGVALDELLSYSYARY
jgi:hypothetical protein